MSELEQAAQDAIRFLDELPADLGRGSWNGLRVQIARALRAALAAPGVPDHREVMQQAVDALGEAITYVESPSWSPSMADECRKAIDALRAALEPKQC